MRRPARYRFEYLDLAAELPTLLPEAIARLREQPIRPPSPATHPTARRWFPRTGAFAAGAVVSAPHHDPIVMGRSQSGDHCQSTLERCLPVDSEPGIEDAVNTVHAILAASAHPDPARIIDATAEP